jgi:hypothetical protein
MAGANERPVNFEPLPLLSGPISSTLERNMLPRPSPPQRLPGHVRAQGRTGRSTRRRAIDAPPYLNESWSRSAALPATVSWCDQ